MEIHVHILRSYIKIKLGNKKKKKNKNPCSMCRTKTSLFCLDENQFKVVLNRGVRNIELKMTGLKKGFSIFASARAYVEKKNLHLKHYS